MPNSEYLRGLEAAAQLVETVPLSRAENWSQRSADRKELAAAIRALSPAQPERKVILRKPVRGDFPFGHTAYAEPGLHRALVNPHGAVSVVAQDGTLLGLKPGEFEWAGDSVEGPPPATWLREAATDFVAQMWAAIDMQDAFFRTKDAYIEALVRTFSRHLAEPATSSTPQPQLERLIAEWERFYAALPDGEYEGLGELRLGFSLLKQSGAELSSPTPTEEK